MKTFALLFTSILAVAHAKEYVTDGSFEDVPDSYQFQKDFTAGGWTFGGSASIDFEFQGEGTKYGTPDGAAFPVIFNQSPGQTSGFVSQPISGLGSGTYTLSYIYRGVARSTVPCFLVTTLGTQTIDTIRFPADSGMPPTYNYKWKTRTKTFTPESSSGDLMLQLACGGKAARGRHWEFDIDAVSLTGA